MVPAESVIFRRKKPMPIGYGTIVPSREFRKPKHFIIL